MFAATNGNLDNLKNRFTATMDRKRSQDSSTPSSKLDANDI